MDDRAMAYHHTISDFHRTVRIHMNDRPVLDIRLFSNTMNRAVSLMKESGINVDFNKKEEDDCIEYIIRIPL